MDADVDMDDAPLRDVLNEMLGEIDEDFDAVNRAEREEERDGVTETDVACTINVRVSAHEAKQHQKAATPI